MVTNGSTTQNSSTYCIKHAQRRRLPEYIGRIDSAVTCGHNTISIL